MGRVAGHWEHYKGTLACGGGDFNVILFEEEKQGGLQFTYAEAQDFAGCISSCALTELKHKGGSFTWWNGRVGEECIFKRLDMVLANQEFIQILPSSEVHYLKKIAGLTLSGIHYMNSTTN